MFYETVLWDTDKSKSKRGALVFAELALCDGNSFRSILFTKVFKSKNLSHNKAKTRLQQEEHSSSPSEHLQLVYNFYCHLALFSLRTESDNPGATI